MSKEMAPAEVESALKILKGFCFTVKLWNQTKGKRLCVACDGD